MKKIFLTTVVVLALLLTTTLMSVAAPEDIPGSFGPNAHVENPIEEY